MTFKKAEMAKTLMNGLSMIEMNPSTINVGFCDLVGVAISPVSKKTIVNLKIWYRYV